MFGIALQALVIEFVRKMSCYQKEGVIRWPSGPSKTVTRRLSFSLFGFNCFILRFVRLVNKSVRSNRVWCI